MNIPTKTFVVTGATGGIGGALVSELLSHGAKVFAVDLQETKLQQLAGSLKAHGDSLTTQVLDLTDPKAIRSLPKNVTSKFGEVDAIINCAGIIQPFVRINDLDDPAIKRVMDVNFFGTLNMVKAFLPLLLKRPEAAVVNVSSMGGFLPVPGQGIYGASKAAVKLMTESLYAELLDTNVQVNLVFPGATRTDIATNSGVNAPVSSRNAQSKPSNFPMLSSEDAAKLILRAIIKNKPQTFTGKDSKLMNRLYRLNPIFATRLIASKMKQLLH